MEFWFYNLFQIIGIGSGTNSSTASVYWILNSWKGSTVPYIVERIVQQGLEINKNRIFIPSGARLIYPRYWGFNVFYRVPVETIDFGCRFGSWRSWSIPNDRCNTWWCRPVSCVFLFQLHCIFLQGGSSIKLHQRWRSMSAARKGSGWSSQYVRTFLLCLKIFLPNPFHKLHPRRRLSQKRPVPWRQCIYSYWNAVNPRIIHLLLKRTQGVPIEVVPFAYAKVLQDLHHNLGSPKAALRIAVMKGKLRLMFLVAW